MAAKPSPTYDDDEINLRPILLTLWKARKLILVVTLVAAVVAFAVSFWLLPRKYQATAYVFVGQPAVEFSKSSADSGFAYSPTLPDINAVVKLSTAPGLLESVLKDPTVVAAIGNEKISISDITKMATAVNVGKDQLSLQVSDTDPQRSALIANSWAEKVSTVVNTTYGLGTLEQALGSQVLQSQQVYNQAQAALEDFQSKNQVNILSAQLDNSKSDLASVLDSITRTKSVLDDLQFFEQGLSGLPGETPLSLGDGLALTTLRQRSLTVASGSFTVQIDSASFAGFTVSMALEATAQMRTGLQTQLTRLQGDQSRLEQEILQLQRNLEDANGQLSQLSLKRSQSWGLYSDLLSIQQQVVVVLAQSSKVASVSVVAVPPEKAVSRNTLMNTVLAGIAGLLLSLFGVLAVNWWRNE